MNYKGMQVKDFIENVSSGNIELDDYYAKFLENAESINKKNNYFVTIEKDKAFFELKSLKSKNAIKKSRLAGIPVSVKDCICTKGIQTTAGSRILKGYIPPFDAMAIEKTKKEAGIVFGKTVQDEFGFGTFSTNSAYGIPKNPHDKERSCGGSSGGCGGMTSATEMPHISIGESTGGSISCPASFCGCVGITPTYGLVSRWGLIDYANSLDKIGPMSKTVYDAALMLSIIAGHDAKDATSIKSDAVDYTKQVGKDIKGLNIGIPKEYFKGINPDVEKIVRSAIGKLEDLGAKTKQVSLPTTDYVLPAYYIIACSESSTNLARYCGMRYGAEDEIDSDFNSYFSKIRGRYFGDEAKRRILLGTYTRMAGYRDQYYLKAMKARTLIINDFKKIFKSFDAIVAPTMPIIAPRFNEIRKLSPIQTYAMDILTVGPNLAGIPMISIPCGNVKGMPVGLHIMSDHLKEGTIIKIAGALESAMKK